MERTGKGRRSSFDEYEETREPTEEETLSQRSFSRRKSQIIQIHN